ncbi:MAG: glycosyltransferase [Muribaculaceae bacterium]|nr:glycosyltransferase [Muribaculaceae bacterium]
MNVQPAISVIVPIYNKATTLDRCFNSIIAQTFHDFEVILVNDGSTDESVTICKHYCVNDNRFKLIEKENGGVSSARQKGLDYSTGKYIIHIDPDDTVEPSFLETLFLEISARDVDMVICDFSEIKDNISYTLSQKLDSSNPYLIIPQLFRNLHGSCWNKLIKSNIIKNNVRFPLGIDFCEDLIFIVQALLRCKKVAHVEAPLYNYYVSSGSITNSTNEKHILQLYDAYKLLSEICQSANLALEQEINSAFCGHILPRIFRRKENAKYDAIIADLTKNIWRLPNLSLKTKIYYYLASKKIGKPLRRII